jgi:hypothetical protein
MEGAAELGDSMAKIDALYLALGATYLVIGMALGIHMGASQDFLFAPLHAHINLVGFTAHAIFGMAYKLWPGMKVGILAMVHGWLYAISAPLFMIGLAIALKTHNEILVIGASFGLILGVLAFCINAWRNVSKA